MPLLLLSPVQKPHDLGPHERNKHPVEESRPEQPQHRKEQPQGQHQLNELALCRFTSHYVFKSWRGEMDTPPRASLKLPDSLPWSFSSPTQAMFNQQHVVERLPTIVNGSVLRFAYFACHIQHLKIMRAEGEKSLKEPIQYLQSLQEHRV